tara:strand:+ start:172 stop:2373 length:2202 start_codon:yes stop_codon:yes gene_type:complete
MVKFYWGNAPLIFPSDSGRIESEMLEYIQEENNQFISYFNEGKREIEEKGEDATEYVSAFNEILTKIMNESKLIEIINGHSDGEDAIKNFTTNKVKNNRTPNESNIKFLKGLMLQALYDSDSVNRLRGYGALKFGNKIEDLPDYNPEDLLGSITKEDYYNKMQTDLTFIEVIPDDMDDYNSEMQPIRFSYGKDNIEFSFPIKEEEIISSKLNHLKEVTSQVPDFTPSKNKTYLPKVVVEMPINIPSEVVNELSKAAEVEVIEVEPVKNKNDKPTGKFTPVGSPYVLEHSEFMKLGQAGLQNRTDSMINGRIYALGEKLVRLERGNKDGAGRQVKVPESTLNEIESKFYPILKKIEESLFMPYLNNPLTVATYTGTVSFKTDVQYYNSLTEKVDKVIEGDEPKIKSITVMVNGKAKQLSVKEAQEMESKAWTHRETKQTIPNSTYIDLPEVEKTNYTPNYNIISVDGQETNPIGETATTYQKVKQYVLKDAPEDAYAEEAEDVEVFKRNSESKVKDKATLTLKEGQELKESIERRRQQFLDNDDADSAKNLLSFEKRYTTGRVVSYKGKYIDRAKYEKLKAMTGEEAEFAFARKRIITPKQFSRLGISYDSQAYKPEYVETKLPTDEDGNTIRTKRRERAIVEDYSIDSPAKFGVRRDRGLAVVTGKGVALNALVFYENITQAFKKVNLRIEISVKNLGEYTLSPAQRRRNDSMVNVIEDIKENLLTLKEKIGE